MLAQPNNTTLLERIAQLANSADRDPVWPGRSWSLLHELGALSWAIPADHGGAGLEATALLGNYETLAAACLTSCFVLSQRDAAVRRIGDLGTTTLCRELLPPLAKGETFATVGISQLTTSQQRGKQLVTAKLYADHLVVNGVIPWVTGASQAQHIVMGATLADGKQILAILPTDTPGVQIGKPLDLMALQGSLTSEVDCDNVRLDRRWLLAGPTEQIMKNARGGTGGLETSCLAIGLAGAAVQLVRHESSFRTELAADAEQLTRLHQEARRQLHILGNAPLNPEAAQELRAACNTLVLQASQTALAVSKGAGFLRDHPAQRWARQALFFLVWSCPKPVVAATVNAILSQSTHADFTV